MCLQCPKHGTVISPQRVISQCLFMTPGCNQPYNDLSSLLLQSSSLFIVTGNYTMERLHHFVNRVCSWQEDALRMFWELYPHLANNLLWSLLILLKNRLVLANLVPKLGTKQPRAMVNGKETTTEENMVTPASFIQERKQTVSFFLCQKNLLKVDLSAPIE